MDQKRVLGLKVVLWLGSLAPAAWLVAAIFRGWLGANPIEKLTHVTGMTTLLLLLVTLAITPLRRLTGWNPLIRLRRPLGLFAFAYALTHFIIWFVFYNVVNFGYMLDDVAKRPYITVGFSAFLILIPMAVTSTKGWIRRLGKRWTMLHKGIYLAATLGVVHFYWLVKADTRLPLLLGACLLVLLALRTPGLMRRASGSRRSASSASAPEGGTKLGESARSG
jgi:methionine sulfoxide reductase heme-binding subunit